MNGVLESCARFANAFEAGASVETLDHLAARMAAEADGEADDTDTASRPAHGADAGAE